jgi:hypothetical protein
LKFKGLEEIALGEQTKDEILQGLKQAVNEINSIKKGKLTARPAKELLDEL